MSALDKVKKIKADIADLPKEYQDLFAKEQTWAQKNPYLYAVALLGTGGVLVQAILWIL